MNIVYFDMQSGISGDMIAGAFCDLGLDIQQLKDVLGRLPLSGEFTVNAAETVRHGITGTDFDVTVEKHQHHHRTNSDIRAMIESSGLPEKTAAAAVNIFEVLAQAEGAVHGTPPDEVHFHEVGAVDSIVDIVTAAFALEYFSISECWSSPFSFGTGRVTTQHGELSVPVPAVVELAEGIPSRFTDIPFEITTPTGAAVIRSCCSSPGVLPPEFTPVKTGYGFGKKDTGRGVNALRVILGTREESSGRILELDTDIDDSTPETIGLVTEKLLKAGALDCTVTQVLMKKGRPGSRLTVLVREPDAQNIKKLIFSETTTFGIREKPVVRTVLDREMVTISTEGCDIRCKAGYLEGELMTVSPEYEDCRSASEKTGIPFREIYTQARALGVNAVKKTSNQ